MSTDALNNLNDSGRRDIIKVAGAATLAGAASALVMASPAFGQNTARERISARGLSLHRTSSAPTPGKAFALVMMGLTIPSSARRSRPSPVGTSPGATPASRRLSRRCLCRGAWQLGPLAPQWIQGRLRAIRRRRSEMAEDVVIGFLDGHNRARGRPVGVVIDKSGALLIGDDVGNTVWPVTSAGR